MNEKIEQFLSEIQGVAPRAFGTAKVQVVISGPGLNTRAKTYSEGSAAELLGELASA